MDVVESELPFPENVTSVPGPHNKSQSENSQSDKLKSIYPKFNDLEINVIDKMENNEEKAANSLSAVVPESTLDCCNSDNELVSKARTDELKQSNEFDAEYDLGSSPVISEAGDNVLDLSVNATKSKSSSNITASEELKAISREHCDKTEAAVARGLYVPESTSRGSKSEMVKNEMAEYFNEIKELMAQVQSEVSVADNVAKGNAPDRSFVHASNTKRKSSRNMTAMKKALAIWRVFNGETKAAVARDFDVPESTLRGWCKAPRNIIKQARAERAQQLANMYANIPTTSSGATGYSLPHPVEQRTGNSNAQGARVASNEPLDAERSRKRRRVQDETRSSAGSATNNPEPQVPQFNSSIYNPLAYTALSFIAQIGHNFKYTGRDIVDSYIYWRNITIFAISFNQICSAPSNTSNMYQDILRCMLRMNNSMSNVNNYENVQSGSSNVPNDSECPEKNEEAENGGSEEKQAENGGSEEKQAEQEEAEATRKN